MRQACRLSASQLSVMMSGLQSFPSLVFKREMDQIPIYGGILHASPTEEGLLCICQINIFSDGISQREISVSSCFFSLLHTVWIDRYESASLMLIAKKLSGVHHNAVIHVPATDMCVTYICTTPNFLPSYTKKEPQCGLLIGPQQKAFCKSKSLHCESIPFTKLPALNCYLFCPNTFSQQHTWLFTFCTQWPGCYVFWNTEILNFPFP